MINDKRIIMIHGLASKPAENDLHKLWSRCIKENIKVDDPNIFDNVNENDLNDVLRMSYWANTIPSHIEDDDGYVTKMAPVWTI